jgi:hypothetical protein
MAELAESSMLMAQNEGENSSGSESAPSEDNLNPNDLIKNLPVVDKALKAKIKQIEAEKKSPTKVKKEPLVPKKPVESPIKPKPAPKVMPSPLPKFTENQIIHSNDMKTKKPKPEMKDAETQTERSDV